MYIVDRFEGNIAVIENGDVMMKVLLSELPEGIREGSVLKRIKNGSFVLDEIAQKKRTRRIKDRFSSMLE